MATTEFDAQLRKGFTVSGNLIWRISNLFSTGIEYDYANRTSEDDTVVGNNRVYAMFMMNF